MKKGPLVSIVICSHNRSADVSECLGALIAQLTNQAEVILVDSASDPDHKAGLAKLATLYPAIQFTRVDQRGLSRARNCGAHLASGDWVVFLDDDAVPFPDWLEKLSTALSAASPNQAVIGGGIYPRWPEGANGAHLSKRWKMFLSLSEADKPGSVTDGYAVNGANYAIRRSVLLDIGGFSEKLGRVGASLVSGDDSHVTQSVLDAGFGAGFDPTFKVYHKISPERLKISWILRRTFWEGFSAVRVFRSRNLPLPSHLRPAKLIASLPALLFLSIVHLRDHDYKIRLAMCIGACLSLFKAAAHNRSDQQSTVRQKEQRRTKCTSISVVVASKGRPDFVSDTIECLRRQTLQPKNIIIVVPSAQDLPPNQWGDDVQYIIGPLGLTLQRNAAITAIPSTVPYVGYFDDDFEPKDDYLAQAVSFMNANASVMAISGRLLAGGGISRQKAKEMIANYQAGEHPRGMFFSQGKHHILFGCNMVIRRAVLNYERFDENLPLYSYGEDYDLSIRLERYGLVGRFVGCVGVHLETPSGRVRELLRGYSFVANNWYFLKKGVTHLPHFKAWTRFWLICFGKSFFLSVWKLLKGDRSLDWSGRAKGHLLALKDILRGRCRPGRINEM
jgi:glucosyl-dolichyl phosphate glucuronosyltransferase